MIVKSLESEVLSHKKQTGIGDGSFLCLLTPDFGLKTSSYLTPPPANKVSPVSQRDSSDARNTATNAISSG